jgi:glycerol uptake facilitator-like aquaporin
MGVFFYVWTGVGANVSFILTTLGNQPGLGSAYFPPHPNPGIPYIFCAGLFQVGAGYGIGIVLALTVNVATSGAHINPCITIAFATFRGFPWKKVPQYIIAQIFGAYLACLVIYLQYKDVIVVSIHRQIVINWKRN